MKRIRHINNISEHVITNIFNKLKNICAKIDSSKHKGLKTF